MEEHNDDKPVGRLLNRREVLALLGGSGVALLAGLNLPSTGAMRSTATPAIAVTPAMAATPLPACVVRPELTEGPYFVDGQLNRMDIRLDPTDGSIKAGLPLRLIYRVSNVANGVCMPLAGAQVDVWHCDAAGVYSGVRDASFDTSGEKWLRGYQITDERGIAEFITIVPGWYPGRAVHIHFKIRVDAGEAQAYEFTSQFFFDPDVIETIYAEPPYAAKGLPNTPNTRDNIYQQSGGALTLELIRMTADELEAVEAEAGYTATFDIGLDLTDDSVAPADGFGGRPGRP
ncbi:MAG: intradiol ring-cleavage dioxygenase [Anaerolinea sp.]|nr:intradiol ring-cleavage dioxygenase [Anaerolinea sp.]